jgi:hypothetical protein
VYVFEDISNELKETLELILASNLIIVVLELIYFYISKFIYVQNVSSLVAKIWFLTNCYE